MFLSFVILTFKHLLIGMPKNEPKTHAGAFFSRHACFLCCESEWVIFWSSLDVAPGLSLLGPASMLEGKMVCESKTVLTGTHLLQEHEIVNVTHAHT